MIFEKTRDGEYLYDVYSRLVKERILFLAEEVNAESATTIAATMLWLSTQNADKPISIYINSPGGSVCDGLFTIYDMMNYVKAPIHTVCIGTAYSAASLILAAGQKKERRAFPNAEIMIHEVQSGTIGSASVIERESARIKTLNSKLMDKLAFHTGQSVDKIKSLCKDDTFLYAEEALQLGLIDKIVDDGKVLAKRTVKKSDA